MIFQGKQGGGEEEDASVVQGFEASQVEESHGFKSSEESSKSFAI